MIPSFLVSSRQNQIDAIQASIDRDIEDSEYETLAILESLSDTINDEFIFNDGNPLSSSEVPIWKRLQDKEMKIDVLNSHPQACGEYLTDIDLVSLPKDHEASDSRDLTFEIAESSNTALLRECEIISQQVSQLLLESKQKTVERAHTFEELSHLTTTVESLNSKVEILAENARSFRLQVRNLTHDYQLIEEQISDRERNLRRAALELEIVRVGIL